MVLSPGKRASNKVPGKEDHPPKKSPTGLVKLQRGSKPLRDKKFYLDLKNHATATKLENSLRAFGAVVDPFIGQDINIVVTDRPDWGSIALQNGVASPSCPTSTSSSLKPSPSPSPLPCLFSPAASPAGRSRGSNNSPACDSPGEAAVTTRRHSRSRAEAMLDRVRLQPQVKVQNPLTDAQKWKIPIWTLEKVLKFLEKIEHAIAKNAGEGLSKAKRPKGGGSQKVRLASGNHFLKVEANDRKCRPSFKDLPGWPKINLDGEPGTSPFLARQPLPKLSLKKTTQAGQPTTSKTISRAAEVPKVAEKTTNPPAQVQTVKVVRDELLSGYCEVCKLDYSDLYQHTQTLNHQNYAKNSINYASLDAFINSRSLSVNDYLEKAEDKPKDICAGGRQRNCSSEGRGQRCSGRSPRADPASAPGPADLDDDVPSPLAPSPEPPPTVASPPPSPSPPAQAEAAGPIANNANMRQSVDERLATKMVGRKDALEVHCNGLSNHVQTRFACTKGDRENLGGLFLDERLPNAQLRRRRAISVSCRDLLQLSTAAGNEHYLRSGRGTQLSPALSDNSHPLLNSNSQPLLSPTLSEKSHHLRPRGQLWLSTGALLADDDGLLSRGGNGKVAANLLVTANACHLDKDPDDKAGERRSIRRKRLSAEEKLIEDNRGYYKVEVLNSKLRSTGYYVSQVQSVAETNGDAPKDDEAPTESSDGTGMKEPVVVRFKKIRRSELSVLSDEAENFMFGDQTKSESNSDSSEFEEDDDEDAEKQQEEGDDEEGADDDEDGSGSSKGKKGRPVRDLPLRRLRLKVEPQGEDASNASGSSTANGHRRYRRRRTNTETSANEWEAGDATLKDEWAPEKGELVCSLDKLHFSFESIPRSEVWYQTFERQDRCEEMCFPMPYESSSVLLPYQLARQRPEPCGTRPSSLLKKRRLRPLIKLPRKSPRCHASTLAMLSSRHPFRTSLDEVSESVSSEEVPPSRAPAGPTTRRSGITQQAVAQLPAEPRTCEPASDFASESDPDLREIARNVDSMLGILSEPSELPKVSSKGRLKKRVKGEGGSENDKDPALNYLVDPEVLEELACTCDVVANPLGGPSMDIVALLDSYSSCGCMLGHDVDASCNSSECGASSVGDADRRMRKKRKRRNLTGWDKPKKKSLRKEVLAGEVRASPSPAPAADAATVEDAAPEGSPPAKRKRKLRTDSSPSFQKGRGGVKRLKLADKDSPKREGFRKRGRALGWRRPR